MIRRLEEQWFPQFVALCTGLAAIAAVVFLLPSLLGKLLILGALLAAVGIWGIYDRRKRLDELLEFGPRPKSKVSPRSFGAKASAVAREMFPDQEPPYIWRERYDEQLDTALRNKRFVVVKGITNSGKTRAAYEAIGRVFSDYKILLPQDPTESSDALGELLSKRWLFWRFGRYVLVINDLENRLSALQSHAVRKWLKAHPRSRIIATLSVEHWAELLSKNETPTARAAGKLLDSAFDVTIGSEFTGKPLLKARALYGLPEGQNRLGAYLASAELAIAAYELTRRPEHRASRALALTGINCARAGLSRPIELDRLLGMAKRITAIDGSSFSAEEWEMAVDCCVGEREGEGAILELSGGFGTSGARQVFANPVLVERVDHTLGKEDLPELPVHVWNAIVEIVADGPYDLLRIATTAGWRGRLDLTESLFRRVAGGEGEAAAIAASRLKEPDRINELPEMTELLERASIGPNPRLRSRTRSRHRDTSSPKGAVFDPTLPPKPGWQAFYGKQALRDAVRFPVLLTCDVVAICLGIAFAKKIGAIAFADSRGLQFSSFTIVLVAAALVLTFFLLFGLYRADRERARLAEIIKSTSLAVVALSLWVIGKGYALINLPLGFLAAAAASALVYLLRWTYDLVSRAWVKRQRLQSRVLLISSQHPTAIAELIRNGCRRPMQMVGYLSPEPLAEPGRLGGLEMLELVAVEFQINRVIIADPALSPDERLPLIYQCHALDLAAEVVPTSAELFQGASQALDDMVVPLVRVEPLYLNYADKAAKRALDLLLVAVLAVPAIFIVLLAAIPTWLSSRKEPLFSWDWRPGLGAVLFPMRRLRTKHEGKVTRLGRIFERLRIDELPQLINVFEGTMSMVGPRPLSREEFQQLDSFQLARYTVLPGITGLWQVARRKRTSLPDMTGLDIVYCRKWTPLLDLTILLKTVPAVCLAPPIGHREPEPSPGPL